MVLLNTPQRSRPTLFFNTRKLPSLCVVMFGLLGSVCIVNAHESPEIAIQHLEHQLDQVPTTSTSESVALMLHRADLHRRQMDWDAALLDYQVVADKEPENLAMMLGRTQLHLDQHQYVPAEFWSGRILRLYPTHALAGLAHARALAGNGDFNTASIVFGSAISRLDKPRPEHYIEHAQLMLATKSSPDSVGKAVDILDMGAEALGHPVSLHNLAYELELESGHREAALRRIEKVLTRNGSLLNWRLQRAELLLELERPTEAHAEMLCLIDRIQQLPEHRRSSRAFLIIKKRTENVAMRTSAMGLNEVRLIQESNPQC